MVSWPKPRPPSYVSASRVPLFFSSPSPADHYPHHWNPDTTVHFSDFYSGPKVTVRRGFKEVRTPPRSSLIIISCN